MFNRLPMMESDHERYIVIDVLLYLRHQFFFTFLLLDGSIVQISPLVCPAVHASALN